MQVEFQELVSVLAKFNQVVIAESKELPETWIRFKCESEQSLTLISSQTSDLEDYGCFLENYAPHFYQINFKGDEQQRKNATIVLNKLLTSVCATKNVVKTPSSGLGLPDLSLVTIRQMTTELKKRTNLCFALVWIEDSEVDNIAIEGSGEPTQFVGLLARGTHIAINLADKNIEFRKPKEGD